MKGGKDTSGPFGPKPKETQVMAQERQIELSLEMGAGDFSVRLAGITMNVRVKGGNGSGPGESSRSALTTPLPALPHPVNGPETETQRLIQEAAFYRQTSEEIYESLGKLAKEINLSLQDLSVEEIIQGGPASPGERLDQATLQLNDVLAMTERATLDILDLVEQIRGDCQVLERLLEPAGESQPGREGEGAAGESAPSLDKAQVLATARGLGEELASLVKQETQGRGPELHFSLADTLQMLLESCNTEAVKPHLQTLLAQHASLFQVDAVEPALSRLAAQAPVEDGFHQVPVEQTLNLLKDHCQEERIQELLAKLIASAGKIFPVPAIPLEGRPASQPPAGPAALLMDRWEVFMQILEPVLMTASRPSGASPEQAPAAESAIVALAATSRIRDSLSHITEALSFQDLSGQRLLKVLKILRQVQVQVLTLLMAAGNKLRKRGEGQEISLKESRVLAQEELERLARHLPHAGSALAPAALPPGVREPLDQESINELLAGLGF